MSLNIDTATAEVLRNEIARLTLVLDEMDERVEHLIRRIEGTLGELRVETEGLRHQQRSVRTGLISVSDFQDRLIDGKVTESVSTGKEV